jgi:hypothetical protein
MCVYYGYVYVISRYLYIYIYICVCVHIYLHVYINMYRNICAHAGIFQEAWGFPIHLPGGLVHEALGGMVWHLNVRGTTGTEVFFHWRSR